MARDTHERPYRLGTGSISRGTGRALVLLPGLGVGVQHLARWGYFSRFEDSCTVIGLDAAFRGAAASAPRSAYDEVDRIAAVLDQEGLETATIWGYSRGAPSPSSSPPRGRSALRR